MLPAANRLKKDKDFERLFARGFSVRGDGVFVKTLPRQDNKLRIAVVVGTKVSKNAVVRNRLRRQMREITRLLLPSLRQGFDVAISAGPAALKMSYKEMEATLQKAFRKARLL